MLQLTLGLGMLSSGLLVFGAWYAWYIYHKPFSPKYTWASVFFGVSVTLLGYACYLLFRLPFWMAVEAALAIFVAFALTGGPMIVGQLLKGVNSTRDYKAIRERFFSDGCTREI